MLDNFIFSISAALPIFLVMCIGYLLKRNEIININFIAVANKMVFYIALPIKLFNDVRLMDVQDFFDFKFISFIILATILSVIFPWAISHFAINKESQKGAFIQGSFRGNFLYLGFSLMENLKGTIGAKAPMVVALVVPLYNILAVIIFSLTRKNKEIKISILDSIFAIIKNPLIIAIFFGVIASAIEMQVPLIASRTMEYFQALATPLALISIGATFDFKKISDNIKPAVVASILKLVLIPILAVVAGVFIGFNNDDVLLIYVLYGVPTATVSFIIAAAMDGDKELASSIVMLSTILSVVSMTIFVFVFKTIGII